MLILIASGAVAWLEGYRVNMSRSLPLGIYQLTDREPKVGDLVAFCVPTRLAGLAVFDHLSVKPCTEGRLFGIPLLKRVVSIESGGEFYLAGNSERSVGSHIFGLIRPNEIIGTVDTVLEFGSVESQKAGVHGPSWAATAAETHN